MSRVAEGKGGKMKIKIRFKEVREGTITVDIPEATPEKLCELSNREIFQRHLAYCVSQGMFNEDKRYLKGFTEMQSWTMQDDPT